MRTLIVALDCFDYSYWKAFVSHCPTINDVAYKGAYGPCAAEIPITGPAWAEFGLGQSAAQYGCVDCRIDGRIWNAADFAGNWNAFSALNGAGVSVGLYHLPIWSHPEGVLGNGLAENGGWCVAGDWFVKSDFPTIPTSGCIRTADSAVDPANRDEQRRTLVSKIQVTADAAAAELAERCASGVPDVVVAYWYTPDVAGHYLVDDTASMQAVYAMADDLTRRFVETTKPDRIVVVSDNGCRPNDLRGGLHHRDGLPGDRRPPHKWTDSYLCISGVHEADGFVAMRGPGFPKGMCRLRLREVMPTVARLHGVDVPDDVALWEPKLVPNENTFRVQHRDAETKDEKIVEDRLKAMGYID